MEDLNLTMVGIAQENSEQEKARKIEESAKRFYKKSIQDEQKSKKIRIFGNLYVGKEDLIRYIKTATKISLGILTVYAAIKGADIYTTVDAYSDILEQKMEESLTEYNINAYEEDHSKNPIMSAIEDYTNIQEAEKELKATGDYNFWGENIADPTKQYATYTEDDVVLSNLEEDAMNMYADSVVDEYKSQGRNGVIRW